MAACRRRASAVSALNRVDLPTLGSPTMPHLKPMVSESITSRTSGEACRRGPRLPQVVASRRSPHPCACAGRARAAHRRFRLPAAWRGDAGLELVVGAFGKIGRGLGDGAEQRLEPVVLGFREVVQHLVRHQILAAGMADADAHAHIVVADMGGDRAQAVMAGDAAAGLHPHLAGDEIELVMEHDRRRQGRACRSAPPRRPRGRTRS